MRRALILGAAISSVALACDGATPSQSAKRQTLERMIDETRREFPGVPGLDVARIRNLHEDGSIVFIDTRTPEERAVSTLPGAITVEAYLEHPDRYAGRVAVAYCTVGYRSAQVTARLNADGHDVRNFEGSILAWTHAGGELVGPAGPTRRVHVYGERWNLVADGYEAVW